MATRLPLKAPGRFLGIAAAVGMLTSFAPAAAQAAPVSATCSSIALPIPAGTNESAVLGGDPSGRYLVGYGNLEGLLWVNGQLTPINQSPLSPYTQVQFNAVNRQGVIVGERATDTSFRPNAFIYHNGQFTLLPAPNPGDPTDAVAINTRGDVVGYTSGATGSQPVEWPADRPGTVRVLTTPGDGGGYANGIDEDGTVVGSLIFSSGPYVWPAHGPAHLLPVPAGNSGGFASAIRQGWVAGDVFNSATSSTALAEWNLRTGSVTVWPNLEGEALSVNRWGTLGVAGGEIVHTDGRVVPITGWPYTLSDRSTAAGAPNEFLGQAEQWFDC